jgi:putative ABC transport system permease protein
MSITHDLREARRTLLRHPYFTVPVLLSLAFAIGASIAAFSVVNTLILRPLPVDDPGSLFQITYSGAQGRSEGANYAWYEQVRDRARTPAAVFLSFRRTLKVSSGGPAEAVSGQAVSGNFFTALGIAPQIGRVLAPADETGRAPNRVAVIGDAYWARRFGRDPAIIGRTISIDGIPHVIVGVTPARFTGLEVGRRIDVNVPIDGSQYQRGWLSMALMVRLTPAVAPKAAEEELTGQLREFAAAVPARALLNDLRVELKPMASGLAAMRASGLAGLRGNYAGLRGSYAVPALAILAIAGLMLLLACANWASLLLVRAAARQRELTIRLALGSSRLALAGQFMVESVLLSLAGGAIGYICASWAVGLLTAYLPGAANLRIEADARVVLFALGVSVLTGVLFGCAPASLTRPIHPSQVTRTATASRLPLSAPLLIVQVALSLVLVVGATLFTATVQNLRGQNLGFSGDGVVTFSLDSEGTDLAGARLAAVHQQVLDRLKVLPGVSHATFATVSPLSGNEDGKSIVIPGFTSRTPEDLNVNVNSVGPDYLATFAIDVIRGRGITAADVDGAPHVALVSESAARYYFPGQDPIGRRMEIRGAITLRPEIVGVVRDVMYGDLRTQIAPIFYVPAFQRLTDGEFVFAVKAAGNPDALALQIPGAIAKAAPAMPVLALTSVSRHIDERLANERLLAAMSAVFSGLALALAAIGIYGIAAFAVARRTAELGVRLALGAARTHVTWLVVRGTVLVLALGVLLGVPASAGVSRLASSLLFGVPPGDPRVYGGAIAVLVLAGLFACVAPVTRALRIQPVVALRAE